MKKTLLSAAFALFATACLAVGADPPVKITFDPASPRTDLVKGAKLPASALAAPGSVRFHLLRLTEGDEFVYYMFDTLRRVRISDLASMEKDQGEFAIWNLVWKSGEGLHPPMGPRIHHLVASFVPLDQAGGKEGERVYYRLLDLKRIEWSAVKE
jgi:hypothetical protein